MDTSSHTHSNMLRSQSLDSGVYMQGEIGCDDSLPGSETEHKDSIIPNVQLRPAQLKAEVSDKHFESHSVKFSLDPDTTEGLRAEADTTNSVRPVPPPLPPRCYKKQSTFEKRFSQGRALKALIEEDESIIYQTPSLTGRVKGFSQCSDVATEKIPTHDSCTFQIVPVSESKPSQPLKPPKKPPRLNNPNRLQTQKQDAEKGGCENKIPPQPQPKPRKKVGLEEMKDRRLHDNEQCRKEDVLDETTSEYGVEANEREQFSQQGEMHSMLQQMPETQPLCNQSQLPATECQDKADGHSNPGPRPLEVSCCVRPVGSNSTQIKATNGQVV